MKTRSILLTAMMVFLLGAVPVKAGKAEVVLVASQVSSAADIESAIHAATLNGTRPGIVTLDSSQGDFLYTGEDRTINITVADITLRSRNGAVIKNCWEGVLMTEDAVDRVTVQGLTLECQGAGVSGINGNEEIHILDNNTHSPIIVDHGRDWTISGNRVDSPTFSAAVYVMNSSDMEISRNQLAASRGIVLEAATNIRVSKNVIYAAGDGVSIEGGSSYNVITGNQVMSTMFAGFAFWENAEYNRVTGNRVKCSSGFDCQIHVVNAQSLSPTNRVRNNKLIPDEPPLSFETTLYGPGWTSFVLGPSSAGITYLVDVTPLHDNLDGAHLPFTVKPAYDGETWNDVLFVYMPEGQPDQAVRITVYDFNGLPTLIDVRDELPPGELRSYTIGRPWDLIDSAYLLDLDPLEPSVEGATFERYQFYYDFHDNLWWDTVRVQASSALPEPLSTRLRVHQAPDFLELVWDANLTLSPNDTWSGFVIGPSELERGYVVKLFPLSGADGAELAQYVIQPEFGGYQWNDVLRVQMVSTGQAWESVEYNFKIFACDEVICR